MRIFLVLPDIPHQSESIFVSVAWPIVSKAADKSSSVRAVHPCRMMFMLGDCNGLDRSLCFIWACKGLAITSSKICVINLKLDAGL